MGAKKLNLMIVGGREESVSLIEMLREDASVNILGVVDADSASPARKLAKRLGIPQGREWRQFLSHKQLNEIIVTAKDPGLYSALVKEKPASVDIMARPSLEIIWRLLEKKDKQADELRRIVSRVFERSPNIVMITNPKGNIEYINSNFTQMTGLSSQEVVGRDLRNLCSQAPAEAKAMWKTINAGKQWQGEFQTRKKDGGFFWEFATISAIKDRRNAVLNFLKISVDITARKRAEQMLRREYRTTRRIIENAPFGIYVVTAKGNIDYVNPAMLKISGESYKKFLHLNVFELPTFKKIGLADRIKTALEGEYFRMDAVEYTSYYSGKANVLNFIGIPLEEEGARKVLIIAEDISGLKKSEEGLRRANQELRRLDQMKSDFISTVSHEFRTPLTSIREAVSQVLEGLAGKISRQQKRFLSMAREDADRLWKIVTSLLDVSKIESGRIELKRTLVDIREIIKNAGSEFQALLQDKDQLLHCTLPKQSVDLFVDTGRITEVISNLLSNAYKFTKKGGRITISVKDKEREAEIRVKDTGVGIARANIAKLFDKFTQFGKPSSPKEKGVGLGLVICKGIVQLHGGRIWAESKLGQGSTFAFTLPKVSSEIIFKEYIESGIKEATDKESGLSLVVLKIEDFADLSKILPGISRKDILRGLEKEIREVLRKDSDVFLKDTGECVVLLSGVDRLGASIVKDKIAQAVRRYIDKFRKKYKKALTISTGLSIYPEEAKTGEELLLKARVKLKDIFSGPERRRYARGGFRIDVGFAQGQAGGRGWQSVDLSEGGMCISCDHYIKPGAKSELSLNLPKKFGRISFEAIVRWIKKVEETKEYRVGVEFSRMSAKDKKILKRFLESGGK